MLVEGALLQRRLTALTPRPVGAQELGAMFEEALGGREREMCDGRVDRVSGLSP